MCITNIFYSSLSLSLSSRSKTSRVMVVESSKNQKKFGFGSYLYTLWLLLGFALLVVWWVLNLCSGYKCVMVSTKLIGFNLDSVKLYQGKSILLPQHSSDEIGGEQKGASSALWGAQVRREREILSLGWEDEEREGSDWATNKYH